MDKNRARLITCMISEFLDGRYVGLPSSYLETIEANLIKGNYDDVFDYVEARLKTAQVGIDLANKKDITGKTTYINKITTFDNENKTN